MLDMIRVSGASFVEQVVFGVLLAKQTTIDRWQCDSWLRESAKSWLRSSVVAIHHKNGLSFLEKTMSVFCTVTDILQKNKLVPTIDACGTIDALEKAFEKESGEIDLDQFILIFWPRVRAIFVLLTGADRSVFAHPVVYHMLSSLLDQFSCSPLHGALFLVD